MKRLRTLVTVTNHVAERFAKFGGSIYESEIIRFSEYLTLRDVIRIRRKAKRGEFETHMDNFSIIEVTKFQ